MAKRGEFGREIENSELRLSDLPSHDATWDAIQTFALAFEGYKHNGSFERAAEIANNRKNDTLSELRTCLFFEQRRWRHFGEEPDSETMAYLRGLVDAIRSKVSRGELE
jgi:hypothetical protein